MEHETLQQTDSFATTMDDLLRGLRSNEDKLREQVKNNLVELQQAWLVIDGSLRGCTCARGSNTRSRIAERHG